MARPIKLTPELQQKICDILAAGNYIDAVCDYVGISTSTFYNWTARGERGWKKDIDEGYVGFLDAVKKARSQSEISSVSRIRRAAMGEQVVKRKVVTRPDGTQIVEETITPPEWTADAWFLERSFPDRWGRRRVDVVNRDIDLSKLSTEQLDRIAAGEDPVQVILSGYIAGNQGES